MEQPTYRGTYRAGVIGHTGRGNYGHGLDVAFVGLPGVEVVAVADPDEAGRQRAQERTGAARAYADYRELLARERLDLVAVGPRWLDQHEAMVLAAAGAGVRAIYCEKPFARSLDEADRMLAACDAHGVKVAIAHQNRAFPAPRMVRRLVADGKIGRLRGLRAYGKQDHRGGGQDLLVLGTHMLDLMRFFAGNPRWCHACVAVNGRDATAADVRRADEEGGLIAGDDILAEYGFNGGIVGTYESMCSDDSGRAPYFRLELCGTGGVLAIWSSANSPVYHYPRPFALPDCAGDWKAIQPEPLPMPAAAPEGASAMHPANQLLVRDLLAAVEQERQPLSSGHDARAALEMILAVYESHIQSDRVPLPLTARTHPLVRWTSHSGYTNAKVKSSCQ